MYVGGVFVTIQSLLDSLDAIQAKRNTLEGIAAQHAAASKKKGLKVRGQGKRLGQEGQGMQHWALEGRR